LLFFVEAARNFAYRPGNFQKEKSMNSSSSSLQKSPTKTYDLAIIGGGVNGCGIARDAVGRGLSVLLIEKDDLASGTSSASTKLVHGGLRYLEQYEFLLVRKALKERETLLSIAPHIISPLRILLPHNSALRPKWMIRIGLFLYDTLGGRKLLKKSYQVDLRKDVAGEPIKPQFSHAFEFSDCRVDDARLVVLNALDAKNRGADIYTRTELMSASRQDDHWQLATTDTTTGDENSFRAKIVINAAGPWVSKVISDRILLDAKSDVRLVKGSHIVVPKMFDHDRAYMFQNPDNRIIFAIPYQDRFTLIGTTDVDITGRPDEADASDEEVRYLCDAANEYFNQPISPDNVVWKYSGIRPLFDDGESSAQEITRDYVLEMLGDKSQPAILSVFGGKITTYRNLAEAVMEKLDHWLPGLKPGWTDTAPLPGGDFTFDQLPAIATALQSDFAFISKATALRLTRAYGTRAHKILDGAKSIDDLGIRFGSDLYQREVEYLVGEEWAVSADDIVWRRSKLGLFMTKKEIAALDRWLKQPGGSL
jgi:glycerol-3-phosphate dehydrogenase